jgi:hypothetical protein
VNVRAIKDVLVAEMCSLGWKSGEGGGGGAEDFLLRRSKL